MEYICQLLVITSMPFGRVISHVKLWLAQRASHKFFFLIFAQGLKKTHMNWPKGVRNSLGVRNMPLLILIFFCPGTSKNSHNWLQGIRNSLGVRNMPIFDGVKKKKVVRIFLGVPEVLKHILNTSNF